MGKARYDPLKIRDVPEGEPFIMYSREFLASPAFRAASPQCLRLLHFLELEHLSHAGLENGYLIATNDQLCAFGICRSDILRTLKEAEALGLVLVEYGGKKNSHYNHPNLFTLTYRKAKYEEPNGGFYYAEPTNNWKRVTAKDIACARTPRKKKSKKS